MKKIILILSFLTIFSGQAEASKLKINSVNFKNQGQSSKLSIYFSGILSAAPELTIRKNILQVSMPNSIVWPQVSRKITVSQSGDSELKAYQFNKETVRVRAILPFQLKKLEQKISLTIKDNFVEVHFPNDVLSKKKHFSGKKTGTNKEVVKKKRRRQDYDETYLNYLLKQKEGSSASAIKGVSAIKEVLLDKVQVVKGGIKKDDKKKDKETIEKKSFNVMTYIGKYIAFLGIIIVGIYGLVFLLKRGVIKKGQLGFLNNTDLVSVLNTTYLAPKRSLLVVKVHNKVLLLGSSETGLTYLSDLEEVSELLKDGEKSISGSNFDTEIASVKEDNIEDKVKVKEYPVPTQAPVIIRERKEKAHKVSLSDQIKKKVKDLRPLQ